MDALRLPQLPRLAKPAGGDESLDPVADRIVRAGLQLTLAAVAAQTILHLINALTFERSLLNVNREQNLSAWMTSLAIFSAALACLLLAITGRTPTRTLVGLAGLLAFFSLDEALAIHERVGLRAVDLLGVSISWDSVIWPIAYVPLTGAALVGLLAVSRRSPPRLRRLIVLGLGCLVAAVAAEVVSAPFSTGDNVVHVLEGAAEEGLELAGWALIATALLTLFAVARRAAAFSPE